MPFKKGESGNMNGRPKGSRNKLSETFLSALAKDFKSHGEDAIIRVREEEPSAYLRVIAQIVPKEFTGNVSHEHSHTHVAVSEVDKLLNDFITGTEAGDDKTTRPN